jgi:hypothetical protein
VKYVSPRENLSTMREHPDFLIEEEYGPRDVNNSNSNLSPSKTTLGLPEDQIYNRMDKISTPNPKHLSSTFSSKKLIGGTPKFHIQNKTKTSSQFSKFMRSTVKDLSSKT